MNIVLDAMGTDAHPVPDVAGAVLAAREWGDEMILVGCEEAVRKELARHNTAGLRLQVIHADDVIRMEDNAVWAARGKVHSSMHVGLRLVQEGRADAFVTAGNTGAVLAIATLHTLKRIPGVERPALAAIMPLPAGRVVILDIGANADCRPEHLLQFAVMGDRYARAVLPCASPRVALLSNGEEPGKGNAVVKEAYTLLSQSGLNFIGNVEPKEVLNAHADVVVHDGFTGNVFLKTVEATAKMLTGLIREEIKARPLTMVGGALARPAFRRVARQIDPFEVGGSPLLGVNGVVIIGHGRSDERAIKNAIGQARKAVEGRIVETIRRGLES